MWGSSCELKLERQQENKQRLVLVRCFEGGLENKVQWHLSSPSSVP